MNEIVLHDIRMLHLLWLLPIVIMVVIYGSLKRRASLKRFIEPNLIHKIDISTDYPKRKLKAILTVLSITFIIVALTRPCWNP